MSKDKQVLVKHNSGPYSSDERFRPKDYRYGSNSVDYNLPVDKLAQQIVEKVNGLFDGDLIFIMAKNEDRPDSTLQFGHLFKVKKERTTVERVIVEEVISLSADRI